MLQLWIGRAGTGKSERILETMKRDCRTRGQVLIVPEHVSHEAEVALCRALGDTASRYAEVLSLRNLSGRVLGEVGGLSDFTLDGGGKLLTMRMALQEVGGSLHVFNNPSRRAAFLEQLVALMDELYAYEIAPEEMYVRVQEAPGQRGDKLRDVALLYAAYDARLREGGRDARSRVQKLRDALPQSDYLRDKDVFFDGFSYFNKVEEGILETVLQQAHSVTVTLLGDRSASDIFQNAFRQRQRLVRMARQTGQRCEMEFMERQENSALGHLERYFFGAAAPERSGGEDQVKLYEATTAYAEVEYAAAQIRQMLSRGYRCRDIAVTARNLEEYGPLLEHIFARDGIPVYMSRRSDTLQKPPLLLILGALDAVTGGFEYEDMFRYLKTGLAGIDRAECDTLENYVVLWGIRGKMWLRDVAWTANPDGYGADMTPERQARLDEINTIREKVRLPLLALYESMGAPSAAVKKAEAVYRFAQQAGVPELLQQQVQYLLETGRVQTAEEYRQLWEIFCGVLDQFAEILGDTPLSGEEFCRMLRLVLTQYSVATIPATLDQVKVSEMTRADRRRVRALFLLGCNDHVLPQVNQSGGILDRKDRSFLQEHDLPLADASFDELDNELQNIYSALTQPTERLCVSYPTVSLEGSALRPAFVVERIRRLLPQVPVQKEDGAYRLGVPATALEIAGRYPGSALAEYFRRDGENGRVLEAIARAEQMERGRLSPEAVRALYGTQVQMSASRMDRMKSCHFGYFMEYGLRAKERKTAGFQAPEIGTFLHYLLENVLRTVRDRGGFACVETEELDALVEQFTGEFARTKIDRYSEKSARFRYLFGRLQRTACAVVRSIADEMRQSDFELLEFEMNFGGKDADLPAVCVEREGISLRVVGKVDRVDGWVKDGRLYLRVVDYKTGKKSFDLSEVQYGLGIQMLLYLFALEKEGQAHFGMPVVPAGVLYLPAKDVIVREKRGASEEKIRSDVQAELRRSGLLLQDAGVLRAMEHSALEKPVYLPITLKKDGTITDGVATAYQLGQLGKYTEHLLEQIAGELARGNVDADPVQRSQQDSACRYCAYASACYFRPGVGRDRRRYIRNTPTAQVWENMEKELGEEAHHG